LSANSEEPRLAVLYEADSVSVLRLSEAAAGAWTTVWVTDQDARHAAQDVEQDVHRLLSRFGDVVDISGRSTADAASLLQAADISGIVAFSDAQLVRCAELATELGLASNSPETAHRLTNKLAQRQALAAAGMEVPAFAPLSGGSDRLTCVAAAGRVGLPAVLKFQAGTGSRGTSLITTVDELVDAVADPASGPFILEAYLRDRVEPENQRIADYVSVENIVTHGVVSAVAVTGRLPLADGFRETGGFIPSTLGKEEEERVVVASVQAAHALGVTTGCLHTEIKLTPNGPRIIEVNGRTAGGGIPDLLTLVNGFSLIQAAGRAALSESITLDGLVPTEGIGYQFALQPCRQERRVRGVRGVERLRALPSVVGVTNHTRAGQLIDLSAGSYGYLLTMLGHARNHQEMLAAYQAMTAETSVEYA